MLIKEYFFKNKELSRNQAVAKFATAQKEGKKEVRREIDYYNLDVIISVGYRVNPAQATQFRVWATQVLKDHLIKGYTTHKKRLAECGIKELQQSIDLLQKTLIQNELVNGVGAETIQLIMSYTRPREAAPITSYLQSSWSRSGKYSPGAFRPPGLPKSFT